jgi:amidase
MKKKATRGFDADFGTAGEALAALRRRTVSSRELTEHVFARIGKHNPRINAFVTLAQEQALAQARKADRIRARKGQPKNETQQLLGLPVLVKGAFATAGIRTTCGAKELEHYVPDEDAAVVKRLKAAGAIIIGKTSTPAWAADHQTYNEIAGVTNNPWDVTRTPGGSTGGGAAALAAGFGFLEVGSDIAGSIRVPSHFCGVYGHKPSIYLVPREGHIPPAPGARAHGELNVAGPIARSAEDLLLELDVLAHPAPGEAAAFRLSLPKPRKSRLRDYRVGVMLDEAFCPVDPHVKEVLEGAVGALRKAGVKVVGGWPEGFDRAAAHASYLFLLAAVVAAGESDATLETVRTAIAQGRRDPFVLGATASHREWGVHREARLRARALWQRYFESFDAFLMPVNFVAAFPHDPRTETWLEDNRKLTVAGCVRAYTDQFKWINVATFTGCPATVAPVGRTRNGLPVGLQIMGPYLEDATPLDFAAMLAGVSGGFVPPPGFKP